ncbi:MAG: hypothetical protein KBH06_05315 [Spirochaetes bacterium]|nr:hypothetical protein [Spirochaetota bacterium]MBP9022604.1 hypothetical protein [Spirochaetota bacterium]
MRRIITALVTGLIFSVLHGMYFCVFIPVPIGVLKEGSPVKTPSVIPGLLFFTLLMIILGLIICAITFHVKTKFIALVLSALAGGIVVFTFSISSSMYVWGIITGLVLGTLFGVILIISDILSARTK